MVDIEAPKASEPDLAKSTSGSDSPGSANEDQLKAPVSVPEYEYKDFEDELDHQKNDVVRRRNKRLWLRTLVRGRSFACIPVAVSVAWATLAVYISLLLKSHARQAGCKWFCTPLGIGSSTHSYVGFALFLMMGFRVNESHQRYLDGLKTWTKMEGDIVTLSKYMLQAFPRDFFHDGCRERILAWMVAFPVVLKRQLRDQKDMRELKHVLAPEDLAQLQNAPNMAYRCLYILSSYVMTAFNKKSHSAAILASFIRWIKDLQDGADLCTRIKSTPAAFSYVAHLRTFLFLWLFFLPFTLVESTAWGTPLIVAFVTYGVVGIELNAAELENPFGTDLNDIPLAMLCDRIRDKVRETYRAAEAGPKACVHSVGPVQPNDGVSFWLDDSTKLD